MLQFIRENRGCYCTLDEPDQDLVTNLMSANICLTEEGVGVITSPRADALHLTLRFDVSVEGAKQKSGISPRS